MSTITYTLTDEAPALATASLLPIIRAFVGPADIDVELRDISLAGRIIAAFPERLQPDQQQEDALAALGDMAKTAAANIIKLPNISASIPQLSRAIAELREQGYDLPDYPAEPRTDDERAIQARYAKVLGSAVNPVLREGNSDRRVAPPVKAYAQAHPHSMGAWQSGSKTRVAHMQEGDFYGSEQSATIAQAQSVRIVLTTDDGNEQVLKDDLALTDGEVIDAAVMSAAALRRFLADSIAEAKEAGILWSLHLKATMMKVSDPIMFGHALTTFFAPVFERHGERLAEIGFAPAYGLADLAARLEQLPASERQAIEDDLAACTAERPAMAMVDSDHGITNLHVPSDIIIDASMPAMIRSSGQMWGPDGKLHDTLAVIPDRCYAGVYQTTIDFCKEHGAFDPATMGNVANVGLMAKKAEEYGSHDKTFAIPADGTVRVIAAEGGTLFEHRVAAGDIWRMCQTKDIAIRDWVRLAVDRARQTGSPAIFWLDAERAHDAQLIAKVEGYLPAHDTGGLDIRILPPQQATQLSLERAKVGEDTISVTGNVLRDYLTDLFPILELGTSAKMLSIVPLLAGGGLFETGAGGSAPKHVQQFQREGHLRWDSLGEFLALAVSFEHLARQHDNPRAQILADTLNQAVGRHLEAGRAPSRKVQELDNRGSHFYLALYWAEAMAAQTTDAGLATRFKNLAEGLAAAETTIIGELDAAQGAPVDIGGYFRPDPQRTVQAMRPSATFNELIDALG